MLLICIVSSVDLFSKDFGISDKHHLEFSDKSKLAPVINCPPDLEIECGWDWQAMSGPVTAYSNGVPVPTVLTEIDQTNECGLGVIQAIYCTVPQAGGNQTPACCTQIITILDSGSNFDPDAIKFQQDRTIVCNSIPAPQQPLWGEGACDLVGWSYEDQDFWFEDGACRKVLRNYHVINWCNKEEANHTTKFVVIDDNAPELTGGVALYPVDNITDPDQDCDAPIILTQTGNDAVIDTVSVNAVDLSAWIEAFEDTYGPDASWTDFPDGNTLDSQDTVLIDHGCSSEWLEWKAEVDLWGDGTIDKTFSFAEGADENFIEGRDNDGDGIYYLAKTENAAQVEVDLGDVAHSCNTHIVTWTVNDGCNNITSRTQEFMVLDKKPPIPYCMSISSVIMPNNGLELWATDFDLGSSDLCGDVLISFSDMSYEPNKKIVCGPELDWSEEGPYVIVPIFVWDSSCPPNISVCNVSLYFATCDPGGDPPRMIAGSVITEDGLEVEDAEMIVSSENIINYPVIDLTDSNGHYAFPNNVETFDYKLEGEKNDDSMNGVSTLDLVLIQKHILGSEILDSPYKMIAADINGSGHISAIDLMELRKLILGIYTELPSNDSWRMIDAGQTLTTDNPWVFTESIDIIELSSDMMNENFIGVKVGDVNNSVIASANGGSTDNRSDGVLTIELKDRSVEIGEAVRVDFMSSDYTDMYGYQFTMSFDGLEVEGILAGANDVSEANIAVTEQTMTMSYYNAELDNVSTGDVLFSLEMRATRSGNISEMITIGSSVTRAEAYIGEGLEVIDIDFGVRTDGVVRIVEGYDLFQNEPNPFNEMTRITFNLPEEASATVIIYDVTGKEISSLTAAFPKGCSTVQLSRNDLGTSSGVFYYKLESGDYTATKKMIVIE